MHTGVDLGFGCTAIVTIDDNLKEHKTTCFGSNISSNFKQLVHAHPADRLLAYQNEFILHFVSSVHDITGTIIIEEPMGVLPGNSREIIALKGVYLAAAGILTPFNKIFLPKATQIKKLFTGNGRAEKEEMINRCKMLGYTPINDHAADAFAMAWISTIGEC